jgi:hypothetical protein
MKTILPGICTISLVAIGLSQAQITFTQSNMPVVGDVAIIANDTACTTPVGGAGANQVWNLASLRNQSVDTLYFVDPSTTPAHSSFPTADLAEKRFDKGTGSYYYTYFNTASEFNDVLGFNYSSAMGPTTVAYNPPLRSIVFPFAYNTAFTDTTHYSLSYAYPVPPYDSMKTSFRIIYTVFADGWGSVTTPTQTYNNCLRWSRADNTLDSSFYHNATTGVWSFIGFSQTAVDTTYEWVANNVNFQPANIIHNPGVALASTGSYLLSFIPSALHVSSGRGTIQMADKISRLSDNVTVIICDLQGRIVKQMNGTRGQALSLCSRNLPNGIYCVRLVQGSREISSKLFMNAN